MHRANGGLTEFFHTFGEVTVEMDFRLGPATVRNPDVAYIAATHLRRIDPDRSPLKGAPGLAVEVVSPANSAREKKTWPRKSASTLLRDPSAGAHHPSAARRETTCSPP